MARTNPAMAKDKALASSPAILGRSHRSDIAGDVAAHAAASDHLVGPVRKELLDHAATPRQQAVRMLALRHALAPMLPPITTACSPIGFMMHPALVTGV